MAWRKSCGISDRSHWFQGLSLSTSSREEGMSKSPGEEKAISNWGWTTETVSMDELLRDLNLRSDLGWWNGSQSYEGAGRRTQAVSEAGTQYRFLRCRRRAGKPRQAPSTQHPLWSEGETDRCQHRCTGSQTSYRTGLWCLVKCSTESLNIFSLSQLHILYNTTAGNKKLPGGRRRRKITEEDRAARIIALFQSDRSLKSAWWCLCTSVCVSGSFLSYIFAWCWNQHPA